MEDPLDAFEDDDDGSLEDTYLTFCADEEEYAVPVTHVTEVVRLQQVFAVPDAPAHVRGVINLRGKIIPLLDARGRFGLPTVSYSDRTVVIVLEFDESLTGLIVDAVSDVVELPPDQQAQLGEVVTRQAQRSLVRAFGKRKEAVSFILDVPALLNVDDKQPA